MIYVCSDLHGRLDKYKKIFDIVTPEDKLYILGDVIDRGPDGIAILQDIQKRDNIELFCGNHEWMMYCAMFAEGRDGSDISIWTYQNNGGEPTRQAFMKLSADEQREIQTQIESTTIMRRIVVDGRKYYLCHANIVEAYQDKDSLLFQDSTSYDLDCHLWDSCLEVTPEFDCSNETIVVGHRFVQWFHTSKEIYRKDNMIDIDGGLALQDDSMSGLILLRLNDEKAYYL